jgi:D-arabinose 1-dehydrogenase-like Zn-dependent alcohol dehydrogenase
MTETNNHQPAGKGIPEANCASQASKIPPEMRALVLDGTGFTHLNVRQVPTPRPGPNQMLARVDAAGICTSLIKLVEQGPRHPLLYGWDIARYPLILGDEGSITLVEVGANLQKRYSSGERFVVQPAVDAIPVNYRERYCDAARAVRKVAVGYTLEIRPGTWVFQPTVRVV